MIEIRGEVYYPIDAFNRMNEERIERGEPAFMNPRNAASGALRQKDPAKVRERPLAMWVHGVGHIEGRTFAAYSEFLDWARAAGLPVPPQSTVVGRPSTRSGRSSPASPRSATTSASRSTAWS